MAAFHFHGHYAMNLKSIFDVLLTHGFELTHDMRGRAGARPPGHPDFVVDSHGAPKLSGSRHVHAHHGCGFFPKVAHKGGVDSFLRVFAMYYKLMVYGEPLFRAYVTAGIPRDRLVLLGMPCSIQLLAAPVAEDRAAFLESKGLVADRQTILYAPTWDHGEKRGLFVNWWADGKEATRVEQLCHFVTQGLGCNLIIRMHQQGRYSKNWLSLYKGILKKYGVSASYLDDAIDGMPYFRYADILVSDLSSVCMYFYIMDKPVVHIGTNPFALKRSRGVYYGSMQLSDRCGHIVSTFEELLSCIEQSLVKPTQFAEHRHATVAKHVKYTGSACEDVIVEAFTQLR